MNTYGTSKAKTEKKISLSRTATYLIRIPKLFYLKIKFIHEKSIKKTEIIRLCL